MFQCPVWAGIGCEYGFDHVVIVWHLGECPLSSNPSIPHCMGCSCLDAMAFGGHCDHLDY